MTTNKCEQLLSCRELNKRSKSDRRMEAADGEISSRRVRRRGRAIPQQPRRLSLRGPRQKQSSYRIVKERFAISPLTRRNADRSSLPDASFPASLRYLDPLRFGYKASVDQHRETRTTIVITNKCEHRSFRRFGFQASVDQHNLRIPFNLSWRFASSSAFRNSPFSS